MTNEEAIEALYTIRAYYASLTAGYPKGKDCKGIGDVMCSEIANSCLMAIESLRAWNDVISVLNKYTQKFDDQYDEFEMGIKRGINIALEEIYKNMPKEEQDVH